MKQDIADGINIATSNHSTSGTICLQIIKNIITLTSTFTIDISEPNIIYTQRH